MLFERVFFFFGLVFHLMSPPRLLFSRKRRWGGKTKGRSVSFFFCASAHPHTPSPPVFSPRVFRGGGTLPRSLRTQAPHESSRGGRPFVPSNFFCHTRIGKGRGRPPLRCPRPRHPSLPCVSTPPHPDSARVRLGGSTLSPSCWPPRADAAPRCRAGPRGGAAGGGGGRTSGRR